MTRHRYVAYAFYALTVAACASNAEPIHRYTIADTTFISNPPEGMFPLQRQGIHWYHRLLETLRRDASTLDLGRIDAAAFGPNGTIWIYDAKGPRGEVIRILDSLGAPVGVAGRSGEGPGEYRGPVRMFRLSDGSMLVKEMSTTRALRFAADGHALATIALPTVVASGWVVTPDTLGGWYITASFEEHTPERVGRYGWLHFNNAGEVIDTAWPPKQMFDEPTPDGIAPGRIRTVDRTGAMLTTAPGRSRLLRISQHDSIQATEWRAAAPVYGDEERRDMQAVHDNLSDLLHTPRSALPARKAPASRILTDNKGQTWVQLTTAGVRIPDDELPKGESTIPTIKWRDRDRWAAFTRDGVLQFVIDTPPGVQVLDRSGLQLLGVMTDANGVQALVVWRVELTIPPPE